MKQPLTKKLILLAIIMAHATIFGSTLEYVTSDAIITPELSCNAIIRNEFQGFAKDFLVLHCLIKKINPQTIFEVGTCEGDGTLVITNACRTSSVISLDLPPYSAPEFLRPEVIGRKCTLPYRQVFGDSMTYNYAQHFPLDAWFIDGAHDYIHVKHETEEAIKSNATLIVYHDTDIAEVFQAVLDALNGTDYHIYRVIDTRISYAIK
jgi:hypothetical protein